MSSEPTPVLASWPVEGGEYGVRIESGGVEPGRSWRMSAVSSATRLSSRRLQATMLRRTPSSGKAPSKRKLAQRTRQVSRTRSAARSSSSATTGMSAGGSCPRADSCARARCVGVACDVEGRDDGFDAAVAALRGGRRPSVGRATAGGSAAPDDGFAPVRANPRSSTPTPPSQSRMLDPNGASVRRVRPSEVPGRLRGMALRSRSGVDERAWADGANPLAVAGRLSAGSIRWPRRPVRPSGGSIGGTAARMKRVFADRATVGWRENERKVGVQRGFG